LILLVELVGIEPTTSWMPFPRLLYHRVLSRFVSSQSKRLKVGFVSSRVTSCHPLCFTRCYTWSGRYQSPRL